VTRCRRGFGIRLKLVTSLKNGRRDLGKGVTDRRRVRSLEGHDIGTVVDGKRVDVVCGESEKSCVVP